MEQSRKQYLELAEGTLKYGPPDFDVLQQAIRFVDKDNYLWTGHKGFSTIIWCGYLRDDSEESAESFADGNSLCDAADLSCETYWILIGPSTKKIMCRCEKSYKYRCQGHCGGVEDLEARSTEFHLYDWEKDKVVEWTHPMIRFVTEALTESHHSNRELSDLMCDSEADIPDGLYDALEKAYENDVAR